MHVSFHALLEYKMFQTAILNIARRDAIVCIIINISSTINILFQKVACF